MPPVTFPNPFQRTSQPPLVTAVIPARYASTRLPGKPLAEIAGRPMIEHVYRRAAEAASVDAVVVATDDERIAAAVERFGGIVRLTAAEHRTGTDRLAEVARDLSCAIFINVQGDLPLVEPAMIDDLARVLTADPAVRMATVCRRITDPAEHTSPNVVKVVRNGQGDALYFSRAPIPYVVSGFSRTTLFKHIGMYGYRRDCLLELASLPQTPLEQAESLEQLRALEHGIRIRTIETQHESIEVDTTDDLERVRRLMAVDAPARSAAEAFR